MKQEYFKYTFHSIYQVLMFAICVPLLVLFSCNSYNFSDAQPVDKENIYEFPEFFRGTWIEEHDTTTLAFNSGNDSEIPGKGPSFVNAASPARGLNTFIGEADSAWYCIDGKFAQIIVHSIKRIAAGAWLKTDKIGDVSFVPFINGSKNSQDDSLSKSIDTINNYVIRKDRIYEICEDDRFLEKGYPFFVDHDEIVVLQYDTICVDLGQNAFVRRLNDNFYVLNIRNSVLGEESSWWRLIVLEKTNENKMNLWECDSKAGDLSSMFYSRSVRNDVLYFDSQWTSAEMLELIRKGYFSLSSTLVKRSGP